MTTGPDGDSLGSMLAMAHAVRHFGQQATMYSPDQIPAFFDYLTTGHQIFRELPDPVNSWPLIIIFDTGDIKRTPLADDFIRRPSATVVVNIDHHPTIIDHHGQRAVDHSHVDTAASSNTVILFRLFQEWRLPITPAVATALLTGILTDTGHFANLNTNQESMEVAAALMRLGADHRTITAATLRTKSIGTLQLWGRALSRLNLNTTSGVVSTALTNQDFQECGVDHDASTGIPNFLNSLSDGKIALVLQEEMGGIVKGSLRTTSDANVAEIAKQFGGGGHAKAAGFKVRGKLVETKRGWQIISATTMDKQL